MPVVAWNQAGPTVTVAPGTGHLAEPLEVSDYAAGIVALLDDPAANQLTLAQEQEIVSDPKLFLIAWLVLNRAPLEEIVRSYKFTEREVLRHFYKLDELKVIELQPGNRVRLLVNRRFSWRSGGPVQRYIHQKLLREFIASHFVGPHDEFIFHGGEVSEAALGELKQVLRNTARQCAEIIERDRVPRENRHGAAFVLALRPWKYSGFNQFEREAGVPLRPIAKAQDLA